MFALFFKILPDVTIAWRDVWLGASVTAVLYLIGELAISRCRGCRCRLGVLWIYYSAIILLVGAEVTNFAPAPSER